MLQPALHQTVPLTATQRLARSAERRPPALLLALFLLTAGIGLAACSPAGDEGAATEPAVDAEGEAAADEAVETADDRFAAAFAGPIEEAHGAEAWNDAEAVRAGMALDFGGNRVLEGSMTFSPDMERVRMDVAGGARVYWHDGTAWVSPADAEVPRARFHVLTWPYFLAAPMKLRDPGARLEELGRREMGGASYDAARLTFAPGTGDTPDDWYVVYRETDSDRLGAMAYIVTYGTPKEEAEAEPHAIRYLDFTEVGGAAVPTTWDFHHWNEEQGIHGDPIGRMALTEVELLGAGEELEEGFFTPPEDAREVAMPETAPTADAAAPEDGAAAD